jgi:hypothetical protein
MPYVRLMLDPAEMPHLEEDANQRRGDRSRHQKATTTTGDELLESLIISVLLLVFLQAFIKAAVVV